ncbi:MAG: adenine nucleotide alpha hydrolase [Chloroflexota bacterium]|nr:adenine nucleotide alpha hydrolase [Chloroflexota bacterium]
MSRLPTLLSWSSGKDSAWSLHVLRQNDEVEVIGLLTTVNELYDRVAMHAVRRELLEAQAESTGLPLWPLPIPSPCSNEEYEARMRRMVQRAVSEGIQAVAFGDLFLADIRAYREQSLVGSGLQPLFPLWQEPTDQLARTMLAAGVRAHITCVDPKQISGTFAGRAWDAPLLAELPPSADPCGERGEFHTFVSDGPMFHHPIPVTVGEVVEREGFVFADLFHSTAPRNAVSPSLPP